MFSTIILLLFGILFDGSEAIDKKPIIDGGVRNLRVSTESGHFCDFNNWARGVTPATIGSCTRAYKKHQIVFVGVTTTNHVARWPWCNYDGYNWDWCIGYRWYFATRLPLKGPKISDFSFNYYNYGLPYWKAEQVCSNHGKGWGVAAFNKDLTIKEQTIIKDHNYYLSVESVRKAIAPLEATVEQNGAFWVKRDAGCGDFVSCLKWTGSDIVIASCSEELSLVCQRKLETESYYWLL